MYHLCHWSVNVTCGGQCHLRLFGWPVFCTVIAEYLVFFSHLQVDMLSRNGGIVCHLCHWSVNVTCGGQCHMHLFG